MANELNFAHRHAGCRRRHLRVNVAAENRAYKRKKRAQAAWARRLASKMQSARRLFAAAPLAATNVLTI